VQYNIQGGVCRWNVTASQNGTNETVNFSAITSIGIDQRPSAGPGGQVNAEWETSGSIGAGRTFHALYTRILVLDKDGGRNLEDSEYWIDGRSVDPAFTANEI
jgi:hypothetical protein